MTGKRVPLFKRAKVVTKTIESVPAPSGGPATALGKRLVHAAPSKPVLAKRSKTLAHRPPRRDVLDLTQETFPSMSPYDSRIDEEPIADIPLGNASSSKGKESDSTPNVMAGYSATDLNLPSTLPGGYEVTNKSKLGKALDAFRATSPLLLEEIGKPYEKYSHPLKLQGVIAKHLVRRPPILRRRLLLSNPWRKSPLEAQNVKLEGEKFDLSLKLSRLQLSLSQETKQANEDEHKALMAQESASRAVEEYYSSEAYHDELGEETAYCLCRFVKTFKDVNPSLVAHSRWFTPLDVNAPLSPMEGEETELTLEA
ncbi:hypothetical protein LIER_29526 [Lithospermum erythrorhizon]|uniref:Uncharacterized protein n=1 Tax=Lithospermum erythrorhizon TaxID=34254 RepID=A0AAV3RN09_LITER